MRSSQQRRNKSIATSFETEASEERAYPKTDRFGYGELDRGNDDGKPTFSDGQRGGFVNGLNGRIGARGRPPLTTREPDRQPPTENVVASCLIPNCRTLNGRLNRKNRQPMNRCDVKRQLQRSGSDAGQTRNYSAAANVPEVGAGRGCQPRNERPFVVARSIESVPNSARIGRQPTVVPGPVIEQDEFSWCTPVLPWFRAARPVRPKVNGTANHAEHAKGGGALLGEDNAFDLKGS